MLFNFYIDDTFVQLWVPTRDFHLFELLIIRYKGEIEKLQSRRWKKEERNSLTLETCYSRPDSLTRQGQPFSKEILIKKLHSECYPRSISVVSVRIN